MDFDPYALIAKYWGEELSRELVARIVEAPEDHLLDFRSTLYRFPPSMGRPPELSPGRIRPVLMGNVEDHVNGKAHPLAVVSLAPGILLYAHEIVLDDVSLYLTSADPAERATAATWMLNMRPLYGQGSLFFRPLSSSKRHPAYRGAAALDDAEREALLATREARHQVEKLSRILVEKSGATEEDARAVVVEELIQDATIHIHHGSSWGDRSHRLFRSRAELDVLNAYLSDASTLSARDANLMSLVNLAVPAFASNVPTLVSLRRDSEAFNAWRVQLARALDRVPAIDAKDEQSIQVARRQLREELLPLTEGLAKETRGSAALTAVRQGLKSFGVALVSGLAGYATGGSLSSATAGAAAGKAAEMGLAYRENRELQRKRQALGEIALALTDSD